GDDHLACPRVQMLLGAGARTELAGGFDHDLHAQIGPRQRPRLALRERQHPLLVDRDPLLHGPSPPPQTPEHRVVLEQVRERRGVDQVVDGNDLDVGVALVGGAHETPADAAEPVDGYTYGHDYLVSWFV